MNAWLPGAISALALVVAAAVPVYGVLKGLKKNQPVVEATADEKQALANASNFNTQQGVIKTLEGQLDRANAQLAKQEERITALEQKLNWTTARVEERDEQHDLLSAQLLAADEQNVNLRKSLRLCQKSSQLMSDWMRSHYETEHPGEQPQMQLFQAKE